MQITIQQFFKIFKDDQTCLEHLFHARVGHGYKCPKCNLAGKWYRLKSARAFSCRICGHHIHQMVGTPFEKSKVSLQSWFYAIFLFSSGRHIGGKELQRQIGVNYKTAWRMANIIRNYIEGEDDGIYNFFVKCANVAVQDTEPQIEKDDKFLIDKARRIFNHILLKIDISFSSNDLKSNPRSLEVLSDLNFDIIAAISEGDDKSILEHSSIRYYKGKYVNRAEIYWCSLILYALFPKQYLDFF